MILKVSVKVTLKIQLIFGWMVTCALAARTHLVGMEYGLYYSGQRSSAGTGKVIQSRQKEREKEIRAKRKHPTKIN